MLRFDPNNLEDLLLLKPDGVFEVRAEHGATVIVVHRFGEDDETIVCTSPGHANQVRQRLTDKGMVGLVADAR
ncbi:hypothetical protein [Thioclava electrotropha]|uniref:Uncharacterized protein n=1 Tax=Thioclava electrotropha TaxID=1549850 RepID=A0ABX6YQK0_9RHOB|nr:hypothetical protein [Thioclava electrotropha]QPZ89958.1 hypothetical protein AKL02_002990 [Thioclava electrotropha]